MEIKTLNNKLEGLSLKELDKVVGGELVTAIGLGIAAGVYTAVVGGGIYFSGQASDR